MKIDLLNNIQSEKIGNKLWILTSPYRFIIDTNLYTIKKGFVFDGNSTPVGMYNTCPPASGPFADAGLVHDYFYSLDSEPYKDRKWADQVHREVSRLRGSNPFRSYIVYLGIRLGGANSYRVMHSADKMNVATCYVLKSSIELLKYLTAEEVLYG